MSMIEYQEATYAITLREQLEIAGCEARVAAIVSRAIGELIDHVKQSEDDTRRELKDLERRSTTHPIERRAASDALLTRAVIFAVIVMAASITAGVLVSILR